MDKKKLQLQYEEKIKKLNKLNKLYFNENNPAVSDTKYDELKEIILLDRNIIFKSKNFPKKSLVKTSKIFKRLYQVPMLSLSNAAKKI